MAATRSVIQHGGRFAIPFRQRVRDPANIVKVAVNVQRSLGSKNIADDERFVGPCCRSSQYHADRAADKFTYPHLITRLLTFYPLLDRGGEAKKFTPNQ